jgi:hypothetical protein
MTGGRSRARPNIPFFRRAVMKISTLFYREQAATQQAAADAATLANVRSRNQRAADSFTALADMQDRAEAAHRAKIKTPALTEPSENPDRGLAAAA